jgi:acyl-CoA synthetase (AMP-forming)/AMP-acid ligase II
VTLASGLPEGSEGMIESAETWRTSARGAGEQPRARMTYSEVIAGHGDLPGPSILTNAGSCSWPELLGRTASAVRWLDEIGVRIGEPVPALLATGPDAIALTLAGAATGKPLAPLGPRLTERELVPCVQGLGTSVMVVDPEFAELGGRVAAVTGAHLALLPNLPCAAEVQLPVPRMDDVATILHTSGTTGLPKPVPMTQRVLAQRALVNAELLRLDTSSRYMSGSPYHHIAGWGNVAVALGAGATVVPAPDFSVEKWLELGDLGVTHGLLVPTMVHMLLERKALRLDTLRILQYGAAPMPPDTLRRAMAELPGVTFVEIFGQTEGSPISCLTADDHLRAAGADEYLLASVGRAVPGVELRISAPDGDGVGEVLARGPHLFRYEDDGWQHTGDLGKLDAEGYLYLAGRKGDMIIRGGENVYPLEVENVLTEHPGVADAVVVGMPDERLGETVMAFIVPAGSGESLDADSLRAFARQRLAGFKVPARWAFTESLPRNANGKVVRARLAEHAAGHGNAAGPPPITGE